MEQPKKKTLIIFANQFPYGWGEPYMETEMAYWGAFEKVYVLALQLRKKTMGYLRPVPKYIEVIPVQFNVKAYLAYAFVALLDRNLYSELTMLFKTRRLSLRSVAQLFAYVSRSHYESNLIYKRLKDSDISKKEGVLYAYRFGYQPYVACLLKNKMHLDYKIIARAHRYDLYEDKKKSKYIPMRRFLLKSLTRCYPVSNDGTRYLKNCYPEYEKKIETRYLGTVDHGHVVINKREPFHLVSCSYVVPVKRVNLIIGALARINHPVVWTHFGDGILLDEMKKLAEETLPQNITVNWKGAVANSEIMHCYESGKIQLFVNVSSSEGIPVSIMEANSFGIPCVATNAGGTGELIIEGMNGHLLPVDTNIEEISNAINSFIEMKPAEYQRYSAGSRRQWNELFSAEKNYTEFIEEICSGGAV